MKEKFSLSDSGDEPEVLYAKPNLPENITDYPRGYIAIRAGQVAVWGEKLQDVYESEGFLDTDSVAFVPGPATVILGAEAA
jgi:hypothetical protein